MPGLIDHLVVTANRLSAASALVETELGLGMDQGGAHAAMGTHNRLLSLGPLDYVEALAIDPDAPAPDRPRWFGLDRREGPARLTAWALRVPDLDAALAEAPDGIGAPAELARGDYRWRFSLPESGVLPFDGLFPALIEWQGPMPQEALEDHGARLVSLTIRHPRAGALGWALSMLSSDDRVVVREGPAGLSALIHTPEGEKVLE
ncbi:VOC family protein [Maritimibacter sp. HL-12]|uniref:VOC family protein n=1 Tax=Maritimibacter sp. HL-12 TaxID=1162418 RepID=UPI000A0F062D|nr:VOC family protein [Maritimibacter sp. HL-12]SMH51351.1 Glyoxalase-like domain-containing protein [Maritimibacter sp. HL-12]